MRRWLVFAAALVALLLCAPAFADPGNGKGTNKDNDTHVQLLAINDFHGHIQPSTPGTIRYVDRDASGKLVDVNAPAGGVEYLSTLLKQLRDRNSNTITVGAGDMIGASPLVSGLFHDEPTVEALNALGLQVTGVGNHEFDEGIDELYRMQNGGCVASDPTTCAGGPFGGALYRYLAANVVFSGTDQTIFPPYKLVKIDNAKIAFIGLTLEGTPLIVTPTAVAGLDFRPEVATVNALVKKLRADDGVRTFVVLIHQGGQQNPPFANAGQFADQPSGFADVNGCENFSGDITPIVQGLDPQVDVVVSAHTHQPYVCPNFAGTKILMTSAASFGRLVTSIDLTIDHQTKDVTAKTATNLVVKQTLPKDPVETKIVEKWEKLAAPVGNRVIGHLTQDILSARDTAPNGVTFAGEIPVGDVIADAQLEATAPTDFGGAVIAFMNAGGVRAGLHYALQPGETGRQPGEITYANAFAVQPFANVMQVKTLTGAQIYTALEQQWSGTNSVAGRRILQVSHGFAYRYDLTLPGDKVIPGSVTLNGTPIDPLASYRVAMNNFIGDGGDGFAVFKQGTNVLGGEVDLDALVQYLLKHDPIAYPELNRITRLG
ncbi:MAG TPA: bifunctional metallophosphatase/5'-nucleotidase [Gaiellaceae bacterium]|nr:bifunctional metallophosphatase/5'-nucleotidase [Gaiellaceae bacterium]